MKPVAGLTELRHTSGGLPVAALAEPAKRLCVEPASRAGAVMLAVDIDSDLWPNTGERS